MPQMWTLTPIASNMAALAARAGRPAGLVGVGDLDVVALVAGHQLVAGHALQDERA